MGRYALTKIEFNERVKFSQMTGQPYILELQGNSRLLRQGNINWYCYAANGRGSDKRNIGLPVKEISFISKVKRYIISNGFEKTIPKSYKTQDSIKFIDYNKKIGIGECFDECICIDINNAYWDSAKMDGYIDESLYQEGLTKDKRVRLACLGTFAKTICIIEFDGKQEKMQPRIEALAPHVFFNAANRVYKAMLACKEAIGDDFLFYWTDCIYLKKETDISKIYAVLGGMGFKYKTEVATEIVFENNMIHVKEKGEKQKDKRYSITIA